LVLTVVIAVDAVGHWWRILNKGRNSVTEQAVADLG